MHHNIKPIQLWPNGHNWIKVRPATRPVLKLAYRRVSPTGDKDAPMFQTRGGGRFTPKGFAQVFVKISKRTGIHVTPHALRRTFAILSLRAGMDVLHLQALLGHSSLEMVRHYAQMVDDDLLQSHKAHSPIDNLARLRR